MKKLVFIIALLAAAELSAQRNATVAFYNVENLFDTVNDPAKDDGDFTPEGRYRWDGRAYRAKLQNIAGVISMLGADIVGLAEVENSAVLDDLTDTDALGRYDYVHFDSRDPRGIGAALLYDTDNVELLAVEPLRYTGGAPSYSRDILYVCCKLRGETVHLLVCHLPSVTSRRRYRKAAAESLGHYVDEIMRGNPQAKIIVMGDFNADAPGHIMRLITDSGGGLHNPFAWLSANGYGSYVYRGVWHMYDAILVNANMMNDSGLRYTEGNARIFIRDFLIQHEGRFRGSPFRAISGDRFTGGYSDHLPVYVNLAF